MESSQANASSEKKGILDSLDRDELIRKCKGLLGIAQKAKKAKDELSVEVAALKGKLAECDTQKHADKESLITMQMMVDSLTEHKLQAANKIADLEKSIKTLNQQLAACNGKLATLSELEIQIEAKDKQIQRLTDENEEQEMDLRKLDEKFEKVSELSKRQTQEFLVLEQSYDKWKAMEDSYHKLQFDNKELHAKFEALQSVSNSETTIPISQHEDTVHALHIEHDENLRLYEEAKAQLVTLNQELDKLKQCHTVNDDDKIDVIKEQLQYENKQLKKQCDEQAHKLDKYKSKVCEFSGKLKEMKQSKKLLSETVFEYSKSVTKWHVQISHATKLLVKEVNGLNASKALLEEQLRNSETIVQDMKKAIDDLELRLEDAAKNNDTNDVKQRYEMLLVEFQSLQQCIEDKNVEISNLTEEWDQICTSAKEESEKRGIEIEKLTIETQNKSKQISELEKELKNNESIIHDLKKTIDELEIRIADASKNNELADLKERHELLVVEHKTLQAEIENKNEQRSNLMNAEYEKHAFEIGELTERCESRAQKITELEEQMKSSDGVVQDMRKTIGELELQLESTVKSNEFGEIKEKYDALLAEYKSLQINIEDKNSKITNLAQERDEIGNSMREDKEKNEIDMKKLNEEIRNKAKQMAEMQNQLENSDGLIRDLRKTIGELELQLEEAKGNNEANEIEAKYNALAAEYKSLLTDVDSRNAEIATLMQQCDDMRTSLKIEKENHAADISEHEKQMENNEAAVLNLRKTISDLEVQLEEAARNNKTAEIQEKYNELLVQHKSLQIEIENKNSEIIKLTKEFENTRTSMEDETNKYIAELEKLSDDAQYKSQQILELEEREAVANNKNVELLAEMRELNDVLKKRGEVISSQMAEIEQFKAKLDEQSKQIASMEESLKEKSKLIEQLRNQFDNQSEILSTSTISRADEVARMRDIEDSFEEKYNKLRGLALKLKKKIAEQQAVIVKLESVGPSSGETKTTSTPVSVASALNPAQAQNLISLQKENDRLLDQIDSMKSEQKQFKSEIDQLNQRIKTAEEEAKSLRIVNEDIKATADANLKIKSALDEQIRTGEKQIDSLKNDNKHLTQQLKNVENDIIKIKDIVKQKENEIVQKTEEISKISAELNKLKSSMKKTSVLNLEVEAYEKSLKEMSQKHDSIVKQLSDAKSEIGSHQNTIKKLNMEIQTLNNHLELEKQNSNEYQQQSELQQIKLKENSLEITELKRIIDDHVKESNHIKIELTNLQSQQSENEVEKQKLFSKLKSENENNVAKILSLEDEVRNLRFKLNNCEQELTEVQTDFASYKIKAQAVLRQNQSKDSSSEEEFKEELAYLTQTKEDLNAKLVNASEQQRRLENAIEELKGEKANLQDRYKKLLQLLEETRQQMETMQAENRKQTHEHHEALKTQRLQVDTLNNCFKAQIEELHKKHAEEIAELKSRVNETKPIDVLNNSFGLARGAQLTTEQRIDLLMMERQDGEGSECTSSVYHRKNPSMTRSKHEIIPLDELLNNTFEEEPDTIDHAEEKVVSKEKFEAQQSRVKHLSTLLSEAEMDVARLTEMNTMLKEELRRQERSTEREKEMKNLEYMKNVIFKFLTINNADERAHLVPVLNIILKLSPDESKTLQSVARGGDGGQSTWSNLLPTW